MNKNNIFQNLPVSVPEEIFENISEKRNVKIERIISEGQATSENYWYDQEQDEFVMLLQGKAQLNFIEDDPVILNPGDYIVIPAHKKHRVEWTSKTEKTIWLAFFY